MVCFAESVLPATYLLSKLSIIKERQISTQDFRPRERISLCQSHGYAHFVALMEIQAQEDSGGQ